MIALIHTIFHAFIFTMSELLATRSDGCKCFINDVENLHVCTDEYDNCRFSPTHDIFIYAEQLAWCSNQIFASVSDKWSFMTLLEAGPILWTYIIFVCLVMDHLINFLLIRSAFKGRDWILFDTSGFDIKTLDFHI